jgi:hypothetical protein
VLAVAVDLGDRDRGKVMAREERKQMVGEVVPVVVGRVRLDLELLGGKRWLPLSAPGGCSTTTCRIYTPTTTSD